MRNRPLPIILGLNSFYLSFLYFRLFWVSDGKETQELLTYKYMLYSVFLVYPLFIFASFIFSKEFKANVLLKGIIGLLILSGPVLYFYTFDLFEQKELFYGYVITLIQCLIQSFRVKDGEMIARIASVYAAKLLLWFVVLLLSMFSLTLYSGKDILTHMLFGGIYYFCVGILDILIARYQFLTKK